MEVAGVALDLDVLLFDLFFVILGGRESVLLFYLFDTFLTEVLDFGLDFSFLFVHTFEIESNLNEILSLFDC